MASPTLSSPILSARDLRALVGRAQVACGLARSITDAQAAARADVARATAARRSALVWNELAAIPVEKLSDASDSRLAISRLEQAGYRSVLDVYRASAYQLTLIQGVGQKTAENALSAAQLVAGHVSDGLRFRIGTDSNDPTNVQLVTATRRAVDVDRAAGPVADVATRLGSELGSLISAAQPGSRWLRRAFAGPAKREAAQSAGVGIAAWLSWFDGGGQASLQTAAAAIAAAGPSAAQTWADFVANASPYYAWLEGVVGPLEDPTAANGFLSDDLVGEINAFELDQSLISVSLRAYQSFGSRFALVQKRVIIGDEMGLGKTVQGLAAMAHLRAQGASHFLVVCPASVIINWHRELERYSELTVRRLHGDDRPDNIALWRDQGGVAITTFDSLHTIPRTDGVTIAMLVVDEAHYIKNPETRRARYSRQWIGLSERVLFLSGTPMENRVEEFSNLVDYLRPDVARTLDPGVGVAGADAFRRAVSTVYLRRNQSDVLKELPELVEIDEWEEFSPRDQQHYNAAVLAGNFMAMRQAGFAEPQYSAKLERLLEIVDEAAETGLKVVVFSFFRDTLDAVAGALAARAFGPITGDVDPVKRQELVDAFSAAPPGAVLVCQIQAGGVGLNIQAASVVVLCEPQLKPSSEQQAIARAHRMGQVRRVQVHRLLTADSVDQRLLEILSTKSDLFDQYARRSEIADSAPEARDTSPDGRQARLAQRIVAAEQARLAGLAPTESVAPSAKPEPVPDPSASGVLPARD